MVRFSIASLVLLCAPVVAQDFTMEQSVIASGGVTAQGGAFTLDGTIAQPVAGKSSGGGFELDAGFWTPEPSIQGPEVLFRNGFES